jgi:hypothetical protein
MRMVHVVPASAPDQQIHTSQMPTRALPPRKIGVGVLAVMNDRKNQILRVAKQKDLADNHHIVTARAKSDVEF